MLHIVVPLLGLWLLIAHPEIDARWEDHPAHFWLVLGAALVSFGIAVRVSAEARARSDDRLFLVGLGFLSSAGFLAIHAVTTPAVIVDENAGFVVATPVGLTLTALFAVASSFGVPIGTAARHRAAVVVPLAVVMVGYLVAALLQWPPFDRNLGADEVHGPLIATAAVGAILYIVAAARYYLVYRRRPSVVLLGIVTAFVLFGEALATIAYGRSWHVSWWEWHLLLVFAFFLVAYSAFVQWEREGTSAGLFSSLAMPSTVARVRRSYSDALEALVAQIELADASGAGRPDLEAVAFRLGKVFSLTERQVDVLLRSAEALAHERDQLRRQGALVAVGREASVIRADDDLLRRVEATTREAFAPDDVRIGVMTDGVLPEWAVAHDRALHQGQVVEEELTGDDGPTSVLHVPLQVKTHLAGVAEIRRRGRPFSERDRVLLLSFGSQVSIALENARLYHQLEGLFRSYLSPDVAAALLADPAQAELGGAIREVTVLMADLRGFTPFSERTPADEVVAMLNTYFSIVVPIVLGEGGTITQFVGDAIMAIFNAPVRQPDHALRAARAALAAQAAIEPVAAEHPGWPLFRMGINSGPALVGNVGAYEVRNYTAIGDTTNLAARLEAAGVVGGVVISETTLAELGDAAVVTDLGGLTLKGKSQPVPAYRLDELRLLHTSDTDA